jgi:acetyltransferase-like isoleucine patch superfamily enzyme
MRRLFKRIVLSISLVVAFPFILLTYLAELVGGHTIFSTCGTFLGLIPGKTGSFIRVAFYWATLEKMSPDVYIGFGSFFAHRTARVGKGVSIGAYCILGTVTLADGVMIASRVSIPSGKYQHGSFQILADENAEIRYDRITIGERTWIGEGSIVMADVGQDAIIGGGSVVTRAIPDNRVALGNPARPVVKREES